MQYTTRLGDLETEAHINYNCPCGCVAGLIYNRGEGAAHLGRCCCGRLLWVGGSDVQAVVRSHAADDVAYEFELDAVTLPWGEEVRTALAAPGKRLEAEKRLAERKQAEASARVLDVVCGMRIDPRTAAATSVHEGETYYFCAPVCKTRFDKEPARYIKETK
jgi:Cu+-exporting ATPase